MEKKEVIVILLVILFPILAYDYFCFFVWLKEPFFMGYELDKFINIYIPRAVVLMNVLLPFVVIMFPDLKTLGDDFLNKYFMYSLIAIVIGFIIWFFVRNALSGTA
ncbi:MAG: hypothetical protein JEZ07_18195 [Phycisphaerae bacterium]|nr:hypothetical protein [Phycisphaerae bacterium]